MIAQSRPAFATSTGRTATSTRKSVVCLAQQKNNGPATSQRCAAAMLSAAMAASMVVSAPAAMAIPAPEAKSFGAERTAKLIEESGTPGAARPDSMKTNVPFQAPGISASPRGPGQEQGTSPKQVFKNIKKTIKEQNSDPDSTPLGISKGPLVKEAKKMGQPGKVRKANNNVRIFAMDTPQSKRAGEDPNKSKKRGIINGSFTTMFGGRNQPDQ